MSRQEKWIIIFLLFTAISGAAISFYKKAALPEIKLTHSACLKEPHDFKTRININIDNQQKLASIPGIGPALAQKIINYRNEKGPFYCPEDITKVSGIGKSKYALIKDFIKTENE